MSDTKTLQKLISGGGVITLLRSRFKVDRPVAVPTGTVIDGCGSVIDAVSDDLNVFSIRNGNDVCIRNFEICGNWSVESGDAASVSAAIQIDHSANVLIENVVISGMMGRGIVATSKVENLAVRHCVITDCSISIFLFKGVSDSMIESNWILDSRMIGICVDDATERDTQETAAANHLTIIRGNIIKGGGTSPRNVGYGIAISGSTDTIISNNIIRSFGNESRISHGIIINNGQAGLNRSRRTVVSGNIVSDHTGYGLYLMGQEDLFECGNCYTGNGLGDTYVR